MAKKNNRRRIVEIREGLIITNRTAGCCAGYLFMFQGEAFDTSGIIEGVTTQEEVDAHNKVLSSMEIKGLDEQCKVGQGALFYTKVLDAAKGSQCVVTWSGEIVAPVHKVEQIGEKCKITFVRNGKTLEGTRKKGEDGVFFTCVKIE